MLGMTHAAAGVLAAGCLAAQATPSPVQTGLVTFGVVLGSLFPDIDSKHSIISQVARPVGTVVRMISGHRALMHDPVFYALILLGLKLFFPSLFPWFLPMAVGVATHLLLDSLNPMGIPICYYPGKGKHRIHLAKIKTGSFLDSMIRRMFCILSVLAWALALIRIII